MNSATEKVEKPVHQLVAKPSRNRDRWEFLPALLEIEETPPRPAGHLLTWLIIALLAFGVAWAIWGEVDIVATAQGRLIAKGYDKIIQPLEAGVVMAVYVEEGEQVSQGQLLIDLDPTEQGADIQRIKRQITHHGAVLKRVNALLNRLKRGQPVPLSQLPADATQQALYNAQWAEFSGHTQSLSQDLKREQAALAQTRAGVEKLKAIIPLITERSQGYKSLTDRDYAARTQWLQLEQERLEQHHNLQIQRHRAREQQATIDQLINRKVTLKSEQRNQLLKEKSESGKQLDALNQELIKAEQQAARKKLHAPISGTVQQLAIHTIGGVVTAAQQLMVIVPINHQLEAEALVLNKDIGFVNEGQSAEIKLEAFPFTKYGTIPATIEKLSTDAIQHEQLGLAYKAKVALLNDTIMVNDKAVRLTPGMNLTVEIKIGKRRIIEFLLAPLMQHLKESARER